MTMTAPDVLVVDDDAKARSLISQLLEDGGYRVEMLSGTRDALETAEHRTPSVVVANIQLLDHGDVGLVRQIRDVFPDAALVFTSSDPAAGPVVARAGVGAFDYLEKPFTAAQLMEAVDRGATWHEARVVRRRQKAAADAMETAAVWSYDADTKTLTQHADWLPSPAAVSRLVTDLLPNRSVAGAQYVS